MSSIKHLIAKAFAGGTAPFGVHQNGLKGAEIYLAAALDADVSMPEMEDDIRSYLQEKKCTHDFIEEQIKRAHELFVPWLDPRG